MAHGRAEVLVMDGLSTSVLGAVGMVVLLASAMTNADEDATVGGGGGGLAPYSLSAPIFFLIPFFFLPLIFLLSTSYLSTKMEEGHKGGSIVWRRLEERFEPHPPYCWIRPWRPDFGESQRGGGGQADLMSSVNPTKLYCFPRCVFKYIFIVIF